jgi:hypothetical protein
MTQTTRTITQRTRIGFGYSCHPETPTAPAIFGTVRTLFDRIESDRAFTSLRSGGVFINAKYFLYNTACRTWMPVTTDEMDAINRAIGESLGL